ncbi:hypothetical protein HK100_004675, partial [Physocladia obscura]
MKFELIASLIAGLAAGVGATASLSFPYQLCTSSGCTSQSTNIVSDSSGNLNGVSTSGSSLTMGPSRLYLTDSANSAYEPFYLKNRQLTFTVDV